MVLERALALMLVCLGSLFCAGHALDGCLVLERVSQSCRFALVPFFVRAMHWMVAWFLRRLSRSCRLALVPFFAARISVPQHAILDKPMPTKQGS